MTFDEELQQLINKHSQENISNTPDFILATYLANCLKAFNQAVTQRELWHDDEATGDNDRHEQAMTDAGCTI
jgi:hypothetical protein